MKKILYFLSVIILTQNIYGVLTFKQPNVGASILTTTQTSASQDPTSCPSCSSCCPSQENSPSAIPPLAIVIQDASSQSLYATLFTPNTNFNINNALLNVSIFPPSSTKSASNSYYVVCSLTSLQGNVVQKLIQPTPTPGAAQTAPLVFKTMPSSIVIYPGTGITPDSTGAITIPTGTTPLATSTFFPTGTPVYTAAQQQQILNLITPLSQQFLIQQTTSGVSATTTFGTLQSASSNTTLTPPAATATSGSTLSAIGITITDNSSGTQTLTFTNSSFNSGDLQKGLLVITNIFPPSTSGGSGDYLIIATIKTLDGLKIQKQVLAGASFSGIPSNAALSYNATPVLSYNFVDTSISQSAYNMKNPIEVKMLLQGTSGTPSALML